MFTPERILFVPDAHHPYVDPRAWALTLRVGRFFVPDRIVVLGDLFDFYAVSSHDKSPTRASQLVIELRESEKALDELDALGAKRRHYCMGNHEHRLERYISRIAPALHGLRGMTAPEILGLRARGWTHSAYGDEHKIGTLTVCHDFGCAGEAALRRALDAVDGDVVMGHTHLAAHASAVSRRTGESIDAWSFGWGGDFGAIDYFHRTVARRRWAHACGVGWTRADGSVRCEVVRFLGGKAKVDGQRV